MSVRHAGMYVRPIGMYVAHAGMYDRHGGAGRTRGLVLVCLSGRAAGTRSDLFCYISLSHLVNTNGIKHDFGPAVRDRDNRGMGRSRPDISSVEVGDADPTGFQVRPNWVDVSTRLTTRQVNKKARASPVAGNAGDSKQCQGRSRVRPHLMTQGACLTAQHAELLG
jgi:hypothetical protein